METIHPSLNVSRETIAAFCRKWQIVEFALFGSAARGELRDDSDIDVMVQFAPEARHSLYELVDIQAELKALLGREVDVLTTKNIRNPFRRRSIPRDVRVLYAA
ncbi:MAG: nucleotidyltransferase family protein [Chloroflexota bacterium]|nr:nucleotidyltransferase family protein [Chloroflexota bacterium]